MPYFLTIAGRFLRQEPRRASGLRLAVVTVLLYFKARLKLKESPISVTPSAPNGVPTTITVWNWIDILVVRELFLDRDYRIPQDLSPLTILDLGANIGASVRFFRSLFPRAKIIAVEPDGAQFTKLQRNVSGDPLVTLIQAAATPTPGPVTFYEAADGWVSSLARPRGNAIETVVTGKTVDEILREGGEDRVDLVKLDIEGGEWDLMASGALQSATNCVVGELHHRDHAQTVNTAQMALDGWDLAVHSTTESVSTFTARRQTASL
jgi:FkbM family methyltransferase